MYLAVKYQKWSIRKWCGPKVTKSPSSYLSHLICLSIYIFSIAAAVCETSESHHFPETSFHRIVVLLNPHVTESLFRRKKNITEHHLTESSHSRIGELPKVHHAERHFSESLYTRTSFSRNVICPNVIFLKLYEAERHFTEHDIVPNHCSTERYFLESSYSQTSFSRIVIQSNVIFLKYHLPKRHFSEIVWSRTSFHRILSDLTNT